MCTLPWQSWAFANGDRAGEAVVARAIRAFGASLLAAVVIWGG